MSGSTHRLIKPWGSATHDTLSHGVGVPVVSIPVDGDLVGGVHVAGERMAGEASAAVHR
jgi:hypothetical protein